MPLESNVVNIDGIPRPVGKISVFIRTLIITMFLGIFSFFPLYLFCESSAALMGCISGLGCWFFVCGISFVIYFFVNAAQLSFYLAGLILVFFGVVYFVNGMTKFMMSRKFAVSFFTLENLHSKNINRQY